MSITRILLFMVGCVFTHNLVFVRMVGADAAREDRGIETSAIFGLIVACVMTCAAALCWVEDRLLLTALHAEFLRLPLFALTIGLLVVMAQTACEKRFPEATQTAGMLTACCAILGAALLNLKADFATALMSGLFGGLGFMLAVVLMAGVRERIRFSHMPECMKGFPIAVVSAGLMALAFMGFMGIA